MADRKGAVMKYGVSVRVLVARHCRAGVAFKGGNMNPAIARTREVISLS